MVLGKWTIIRQRMILRQSMMLRQYWVLFRWTSEPCKHGKTDTSCYFINAVADTHTMLAIINESEGYEKWIAFGKWMVFRQTMVLIPYVVLRQYVILFRSNM